jgi:FHA domain
VPRVKIRAPQVPTNNHFPDPDAVLEVAFPDRPHEFVHITQSLFLIGRGSDTGSHLQLDDRRISRRCAAIVSAKNGYCLEDLGHRQGIFVNGEQAAQRSLQDGDLIQFGLEDCCEIVFHSSAAAEASIESMLTRIGSLPSITSTLAAGGLSNLNLRDNECEAIRSYVASGGSVLATFETSRYNRSGEPREDFGLRDIFGVSVAGKPAGLLGNSYLRMEQPHPVLEGYPGTSILPGPEFQIPVTQLGAGALYLSVIPSYPSYPPEMVYPRIHRTNEPAAVFHQQGPSRIVYFPGDIDRTLLRSGHPDFSRILNNAILWILNGQQPLVSVEGKGMLELFAWETEPGFTLHVLNYTNPGLTHPFVSDLYPIGPLQVRFQDSAGRIIRSVRALRASRELAFKQSAGAVTFEVPAVSDYEVIALT